MAVFKDTLGRTWQVDLTIGSAKRVRSLLGIDLLNLELREDGKPCKRGDVPLMTVLATNAELLCDCVFAMIKPQADSQSVFGDDFAEALGGDAFSQMYGAFWGALESFFRAQNPATATAIEKQLTLVRMSMDLAQEELTSIDVAKVVRSAFGEPSPNSPPSPASIPAT